MVKKNPVTIGQFLKEREGRYSPNDKRLFGMQRLNKIDFSGEIHLSNKGSKTDMIIIEPGDLVISGINVAKGAIAVYQGIKPITATIHYSSYKFDKEQIDIEYFKRFVKSQAFIKVLEVRGGIKTEIKPKHFLPIEINLPEITEQQQVVSFFQRIEYEIGELGVEISTQSGYLDLLRKAILQDAIEGKLTSEWRKQNPSRIDGDNHALKLFDKVQSEKEQLVKNGRIRKDKALLQITDKDKPFDLPNGWVWCRLGQIISDLPRNGYSPKEVKHKTEVKTLKLGATTYGVFNPNEFKYVDEKIPKDSIFWLEPNDILIQRSNSREYVGVSAIYTEKSKEFIYPDLMMKIKVMEPLSATLIYRFLSSPLVRKYFRTKAKGAQQTMPKINQGVVTNALIPLPPLQEQPVLLERVEKLMGLVDKFETQVDDRKDKSDLLMLTILRESFEHSYS